MHAIRTLMDFEGQQGKDSVVGNIYCDYPLSVALINSKNASLIFFLLLHASRIYFCFVTCVKHMVSTYATSESFLGIMKCRKIFFSSCYQMKRYMVANYFEGLQIFDSPHYLHHLLA